MTNTFAFHYSKKSWYVVDIYQLFFIQLKQENKNNKGGLYGNCKQCKLCKAVYSVACV